MTGGAISGYCATGKRTYDTAPRITNTIETTAAKIGHVLGVDAVITGDITQFGRDDQNKNVGGMLGKWGSNYGLGNVGTSKSKAAVAITARIIDVNTGEILASVSGKGESTRSGAMRRAGSGTGRR